MNISIEQVREHFAEIKDKLGDRDPLPVFVEQTRKVLATDGRAYRRYGPYWWAMKPILRNGGLDVGLEEDAQICDQLSVRGDDGAIDPALTLLAGWMFGDLNSVPPPSSYEMNDGSFATIFDQDRESHNK